VFKRRNKMSWWRWVAEAFYPKSGWRRASTYVWHRIRRLPDSPHKIARGIGVGVFVSFTPFFGFHFILATIFALLVRGNIVAALLGTFFGNPFTFPIIGATSLWLGHFLLGTNSSFVADQSVFHLFRNAIWDFWANLASLFSSQKADWTDLSKLFYEAMLPYLIGGLLPGIASGAAVSVFSQPFIAAYQHRRKGKFIGKLTKTRAKKAEKADENP